MANAATEKIHRGVCGYRERYSAIYSDTVIVRSLSPETRTLPDGSVTVTVRPAASAIRPLQVRVVSVLFSVTIHSEVSSMVRAHVPLPPSPAQDSSSRIAPVN